MINFLRSLRLQQSKWNHAIRRKNAFRVSYIVCVTVGVAVALPPRPSVRPSLAHAKPPLMRGERGRRAGDAYVSVCLPVAKLHAELNHEFILARQKSSTSAEESAHGWELLALHYITSYILW